jgi:DNA polymerase-3 subunit gamma/tau
MGQALYRKYRTKTLSETAGQEHITNTLANALKFDKISHAYLFTGPRGVGKTSVARILAHEVNNLPYDEDSTHLDIIEIDAASNRRIDEIRDLRERVHSAPTSAKYKVYIIDEVHMLTKEAFNALLKTLEEPPAHVIFILATTEAHKLPETIISRTQHFNFKPYDSSVVVDRLRYIATEEGITITDEALELIAKAGGGSFRDSISLLDQTSNISSAVDANEVRRVLGIAPLEAVEALIAAMAAGSPADVVDNLKLFKESGYQAGPLGKQLIARLRDQLITGTASNDAAVMNLIGELLDLPSAHDIDTKLELILIGHTLREHPRPVTAPAAKAPASKQKAASPAVVTPKAATTTKAASPAASPEPVVEAPLAPVVRQPFSEDVWSQALLAIKQQYNTLYSVTRMAHPTVDGNELTLSLGFLFHQKRLNEVKNKQIIANILETLTGNQYSIRCIVEKDLPEPIAPSVAPVVTAVPVAAVVAPTPGSPLDTISNVFGSAEVLDA